MYLCNQTNNTLYIGNVFVHGEMSYFTEKLEFSLLSLTHISTVPLSDVKSALYLNVLCRISFCFCEKRN